MPRTVAVGSKKISLVLMVTMIVLIMLMFSSQQIDAFAINGVGRRISTAQRIRTRSQLYNNVGSSAVTIAAILDQPPKPKAKIRFNPIAKARQVKEFFDTQLPMLRYLWPRDDLRLRVYLVLSMVFMFLGKWFNVKVPFILQRAIDTVSKSAVVTAAGAGAGAAAGAAGGGGGLMSSGTAASVLITPGVLQGATAAIAFYGRLNERPPLLCLSRSPVPVILPSNESSLSELLLIVLSTHYSSSSSSTTTLTHLSSPSIQITPIPQVSPEPFP